MLTIKIEGLDKLQRKLDDLGKSQIPFAAKMALQDTAFEVRAEEQREMARVLDRPMPYVVQSVVVNKSELSKSNLSVAVGIPPEMKGAIESIAPQVFGGERRVKKSELQLRRLGALPTDKFIAASQSAFTDAYGNIPRSVMKDILSDLQAHPDFIGPRRRKTGSKSRYFVMMQGTTPVGIAERYDNRNARQVLAFVSRPSYQAKRFDFYSVANAVIYRAWKVNFRRRFREAMATAK
jgi:hypothetical protein